MARSPRSMICRAQAIQAVHSRQPHLSTASNCDFPSPAGTPIRQARDAIIARRGPQARNIAKVAAARKLLTCVFYAMRDGQVRSLAARSRAAEAG